MKACQINPHIFKNTILIPRRNLRALVRLRPSINSGLVPSEVEGRSPFLRIILSEVEGLARGMSAICFGKWRDLANIFVGGNAIVLFLLGRKPRTLIRGASLISVIMFLCCFYALAAVSDYLYSNEISVIIGETKPLSVSNPRQVKINNPNLLDVTGAGRKELLLSGKSEGETNLIVVDDFGEHKFIVKIYKEDLEKAKERVDILLKTAGFDQITTEIGEKERKIFVLGKLLPSKKDALAKILEPVGDKIINLVEFPEKVNSVLIDVEVIELDKTASDDLGFNWAEASRSRDLTVSMDQMLSPSHAFRVLKSPWGDKDFSVTLNYYITRNKARLLSRPKLVVLSGQEAKLDIGGEAPYITAKKVEMNDTGTTIETTYEVEQKPYGLTLNIKPTILENDEVKINLQAELKEIDESVAIAIETNIDVPGSTKRNIQTELTVMNGQTVMLAGLIKTEETDNRGGIAGLSRIPFLGALFRNKDYDKVDKEIVITLRPIIIKNKTPEEISAMTTTKVPLSSERVSGGDSINSVKKGLTQKEDPVINYSNLILNIINSNLKYPQDLSKKGIAGSVKLSLHLLSTGKLLGVVVMQSSGNSALDELAENTVKRLSPFPAFPQNVNLKELWIDIPIVYEAG